MKNFLLMAVLVLFTSGAFAVDPYAAGFDKLTPAQQAKILADVEQFGKQNSPNVVSVDNVEKFAKIGPVIGQTIAAVAKEMNVAVNDFIKTPAGTISLMLIVWYMMGGVVVHVMGGILVWIIGLSFTTWVLRRAPGTTTTCDKDTGKVVKIVRERLPDNGVGYWFAYAVVVVAGLIVMFTY